MTELGSTQYQGPAQEIQEVEKSEDSEYSEDFKRIAREDYEDIDTINVVDDPQEILDNPSPQEIAEGDVDPSEYDVVAAQGNDPLIAVSKGEAGFGYDGEEENIEGQVYLIDKNASGYSDGRTGKVSPGKLVRIAEAALTEDNGEELSDGVQTALTPDGPGMVDGETGDRLPGNRSKKYSGQWEEIEDDAELM